MRWRDDLTMTIRGNTVEMSFVRDELYMSFKGYLIKWETTILLSLRYELIF